MTPAAQAIENVARYLFWVDAVNMMRLCPSWEEAPEDERRRLRAKAKRIINRRGNCPPLNTEEAETK